MELTHRSDAIEELITALVKAQGAFQTITKGETAVVKSKRTGKTHSYNYATLPNVLEATRPALLANGIAVVQTTEARITEGVFEHLLVTTLYHTSGQWISGEAPINMNVSPHEIGSFMTYLRRYSLMAIIGVAAEEDDDDAGKAQAGSKGSSKGSSSSSGHAPPAPPQDPQDTPDRAAEIPNPFTGFIQNIETFKGEKNGKKWTRYHMSVTAVGDDSGNSYEFRTFSDTHADLAGSAKRDHRSVVIEFESDKFGRKIKSLDLGSEDDVPF